MLAPSRRDFALGLSAALIPMAARAQQWPEGVTQIIVPFAAGGSVDAMGRILAEGLRERTGANFIVENRPGASGSIGAGAVAKSRPDGKNWLLTFDTHAVIPALLPWLPFDPNKDLLPVLLIGFAPMVIVTKADGKIRSIDDLIERGRNGNVNYGTGGPGTLAHLAMTLLAKSANSNLQHVAYRGGAPAVNDAIAGHIDAFAGSITIVAEHVKAGTLRILAQTGAERSPYLPEVRTLKEAGYEGIEAKSWWGVFAPAGTPDTVLSSFNDHAAAVFKEPKVQKILVEAQQVELALMRDADFATFYRDQEKKWGAVVKDYNITAG